MNVFFTWNWILSLTICSAKLICFFQEKTKFGAQPSSNSGGTTSTTSSAYSAKPNFIPNPLLGDLPYDVSSPGQRLASAGGSGVGGGSTTSEIPPIMREQTINKVMNDFRFWIVIFSRSRPFHSNFCANFSQRKCSIFLRVNGLFKFCLGFAWTRD